jgi:Ulp1 family protease
MQEKKSTDSVAQAPAPSIVNYRRTLDMYINSILFIRPSREVSLAHTHLQRAFMWLGKAQGATGSESPYKESFNPQSATIEPTSDHSTTSLMDSLWDLPEYGTHTARVKSLRAQISEHLKGFTQLSKAPNAFNDDYAEFLKQSRLAVMEASMWLGWELARIKKEQENPPSSAVGLPPHSGLPL